MSKALGVIPARWGSTRFPGKPMYSIAGKPLLRHVWERCQRAKKLDALIIATGLPFHALSPYGRDAQSIAFFKPPGIE